MIGALTGAGITILSDGGSGGLFTELQFSHYAISFLTDDIIRMRYVEIDGQLRRSCSSSKCAAAITAKTSANMSSRRRASWSSTRANGLLRVDHRIPYRTGPRKAQENEAAPEPRATK